MYFRGIGTATPPTRSTKAECLDAFQRSDWFARLNVRSHFIARTVLQRDNGIEARRLAVDRLADVFTIDPDTLSQRFLAHAPVLAAKAGQRELARAGLQAADIGAAMYLDNDPGVFISACSFGDGAGAAVVSRLPKQAERRVEWIMHAGGRDVLLALERRFELEARISVTAPRCCASTEAGHAHLSTLSWRPRWRTMRRAAGGGCRPLARASAATVR